MDLATGAVTSTITLGNNPEGIAISPDGAHLYVPEISTGNVVVIDTATSPAEAAGTVDITITTPGGTSSAIGADQYTYVTPFTFIGFLLPVLNPPFTNLGLHGLNIFMNFTLGGNKGTGVIAAGYPTTQRINCRTHTSIGSATPTASTGFTYIP